MDKTKLIIWTKRNEIESLKTSHLESPLEGHNDYWQGKAQAFSQVWEYLVFNGKEPHPERYNQENNYWSRVVEGLASVDDG